MLDARAQNMRQPVVSRNNQPAQESSYEAGLPKPLENVGIDQNLEGQLPLDATFTDDAGRAVNLGEFFGKRPVVFAFAYYTCPMLCGQVLQGVTGCLKTLTFDVGNEYDIVVVSINPRDSVGQAAKAKRTYIQRYGREHTAEGWHFLVGDQSQIDRVTKAAGFRYTYDSVAKQYAHGAAMMVVTPEGKLSKYFFGIEFAPKDVKFALMEATEGKIGSIIDQAILYCFHYDPSTGKYGPAVVKLLRIGAGLTVFGIGFFYVAMRRRSRRSKSELQASVAMPLAPEQRN